MRKSPKIFLLEVAREVETHVEDSVHAVTDNVQRQKVETQSNDRFSSEVENHLRVEGNTPCCKINPTNDERDEDQWP